MQPEGHTNSVGCLNPIIQQSHVENQIYFVRVKQQTKFAGPSGCVNACNPAFKTFENTLFYSWRPMDN